MTTLNNNILNPYQLEPVFNFAALRLLNTRSVPSQLINVVCGVVLNDGYGGLFSYDPNSVYADDNYNIIVPTNSIKGRWIRVNNATGGGGGGGGVAVAVGASVITNGTINFISGNNVSIGLAGSNLSFSVPTQTSLNYANGNGVTFGILGSTLTASVNTAGVASPINISAGTTSNNLTALTFSNQNNVSFGLNGSVITGSIPSQTSLSYSNVNGMSFGIAGSTLTASYTVPSTAGHISGINLSAGTTSNNLSAITFSNSNGLSFGLNGSIITGSYTVPSTAGLLSNINISAGTTSSNASNLILSNSNNVSFGLAGNTITASASFAQTSFSRSGNVNGNNLISNSFGNNNAFFWPFDLDVNASFSILNMFLSNSMSLSSNSSFGASITMAVGIYSRNGSTLSVMSSGSRSLFLTNSASNATSVLSGYRNLPIPITANMTPGNYWIGLYSVTQSINTNWLTMSNVLVSAPNNAFSGALGSAPAVSNQVAVGLGAYSTTATSLLASYALSDLRGTASNQQFIPLYDFRNF